MLILGIETSCDETAAAVVASDGRVLSNIVASQVEFHAPFGGVVPEIASRRHVEVIVPVVDKALSTAGVGIEEIDAFAVTVGPGLIGALLIGISAGGAMAWAASKPIVGVNHIRGHFMAAFLRAPSDDEARECGVPDFPFVALVVSGGHTSLFFVKSATEIELLGRTRDDAAGEALDKGAKVLGLGYPGGPQIEKYATKYGGNAKIRLPRGLLRSSSLDFSFSGVKTALALKAQERGSTLGDEERGWLCHALQEAIVEVLVEKAIRACTLKGASRLVVAGGVASNSRLRSEFYMRCADSGIEIFIPQRRFCTDNAAMIALAGTSKLEKGVDETGKLRASPYMDLCEL